MRKHSHVAVLAAVIALSLILAFSLTACSSPSNDTGSSDQTSSTTSQPKTDLVLASTTSTQDSGLFDVLIPAFEKANPDIKVKVVAVGTGEALQKGKDGDADVLLVHAKQKEEDFVKEGYADKRTDVMYNDFIIVGPANDPAGIKGSANAAEAFKKISTSGATFISRGDESGTNTKELGIWKDASIDPAGKAWYKTSGQGMGETLKMSDEMNAYTLSDRATYLSMQKKDAIKSALVYEKSKDLLNQYGVLVVKDAKEKDAAQTFADWITSPEGQKVISEFGVQDYGQQLFIPNAPTSNS